MEHRARPSRGGGARARHHRSRERRSAQGPTSFRLRGRRRLRTGERASAPDASGVRRRTESDRTTDWLRNLEQNPAALIRIADAEIPARYERSVDPAADLRRVVELLRRKYGAEWVADWYLERGRIPVKLRVGA